MSGGAAAGGGGEGGSQPIVSRSAQLNNTLVVVHENCPNFLVLFLSSATELFRFY